MAANFLILYSGNADEIIAKAAARLSGPMLSTMMGAQVAPYLRSRAQARFNSEGDDAVGDWAPLAPSTIQIRETMGYGAAPINDRTGAMKRWVLDSPSVAAPTPFGATLAFPGDTPNSQELRKKLIHAQYGGVSESGRPFPARPVFGASMTDLTAIVTMISFYLEAAS